MLNVLFLCSFHFFFIFALFFLYKICIFYLKQKNKVLGKTMNP
jgi:hypothetical protein